MPVTIKPARLKYKDTNGDYIGIDALTDKTTAQRITEINSAGTTQTNAVNSAGTAKVTAVNDAGAAQIQAIGAKGIEVLESIPEDYSELSGDVSDLKSAINVLEPVATSEAVGKTLVAKTVENGKVTEYELGDTVDITIKYPNLMDIATQKSGYIKSDGTINNTGAAVYASVPINRSDNEHFSVVFPGTSPTIPNGLKTFVLAFYNNSSLISYVAYKDCLSPYKYNNIWYLTAEIPVEANLVLFTLKVGTTDFTTGTIASYGNYIDNSSPYIAEINSMEVVNEEQAEQIDQIVNILPTIIKQSDFSVVYPNLMEISTQEEGYINGSGSIGGGSGTAHAIVPIDKSKSDYVSIFFASNGTTFVSGGFVNFSVAFYNDNTLVSYTLFADCLSQYKYYDKWYLTAEIPTGANYMMFTTKVGTFDATTGTIVSYGLQIDDGKIYTDKVKEYAIRDYEANLIKKVLRVHSNLTGKKMTVIGDSITYVAQWANTNWHKWIADWTGCTVQNLGYNGTGFMRNDPYINRIPLIDLDTDIIGIAASLNDCDFNIGTVDDDTSDNTALGYANDFFDALITAFPNTPIICYVQNPWGDRHYGVERSDSFVNGVQTICHRHGVPFYGDMYLNGSVLKPWITENCDEYFTNSSGTSNTAHPNDLGHLVIANYLLDKFEQNVTDHYIAPWQLPIT